jgi:hypothetical protein
MAHAIDKTGVDRGLRTALENRALEASTAIISRLRSDTSGHVTFGMATPRGAHGRDV